MRPLRLREAHLGTNAEQATLTLAKPAGTTEARTHLRRLWMVVFAVFSPLHAIALSQLDHTQMLSHEFADDTPRNELGRVSMPDMLLGTIKALPQLRELTLAEPIASLPSSGPGFAVLQSLKTHYLSLDWTHCALTEGIKRLALDVRGAERAVRTGQKLGLVPWSGPAEPRNLERGQVSEARHLDCPRGVPAAGEHLR